MYSESVYIPHHCPCHIILGLPSLLVCRAGQTWHAIASTIQHIHQNWYRLSNTVKLNKDNMEKIVISKLGQVGQENTLTLGNFAWTLLHIS